MCVCVCVCVSVSQQLCIWSDCLAASTITEFSIETNIYRIAGPLFLKLLNMVERCFGNCGVVQYHPGIVINLRISMQPMAGSGNAIVMPIFSFTAWMYNAWIQNKALYWAIAHNLELTGDFNLLQKHNTQRWKCDDISRHYQSCTFRIFFLFLATTSYENRLNTKGKYCATSHILTSANAVVLSRQLSHR